MTPWRSFGIPELLDDLPVLVQANAEFFLHRATRKRALKMLENGQIHLLGSDCHDLKDRCPNLGPAKELILQQLGPQALAGVTGWEQQILTGLQPL
jgi:protein-tyrosine phosphatase